MISRQKTTIPFSVAPQWLVASKVLGPWYLALGAIVLIKDLKLIQELDDSFTVMVYLIISSFELSS